MRIKRWPADAVKFFSLDASVGHRARGPQGMRAAAMTGIAYVDLECGQILL